MRNYVEIIIKTLDTVDPGYFALIGVTLHNMQSVIC